MYAHFLLILLFAGSMGDIYTRTLGMHGMAS